MSPTSMAIPKYIGGDRELSTTGVDAQGVGIDPWIVTQNILASIDSAFVPHALRTWNQHSRGTSTSRSTDCLRHWGPNGACWYCDMSHVEACTPSCLEPRAFAAHGVSTLLVAEAARKQAELESDQPVRYSLSAANADLLNPAISWGSHISVSISTALWEDLIVEQRHPAILGFVASALAAAVPFFGAGYLLPFKNGETIYSLSGRAHHLTQVKTHATTQAWQRGLLNTRREPHGTGQERLHLIGFDFSILGAALKCSFLQCMLAVAEEAQRGMSLENEREFYSMNLVDPVRSLREWSWKIDLKTGRFPATARLATDRQDRERSLPRYMQELAGMLLRMCESGLISDAIAPDARELLPRIIALAHYAEEGSISRCAPHLDWAAKLTCLQHVCEGQGATFGDPATRLIDHDFSNTDPERGTLWRLWREGLVDPLITLQDAERCIHEGPAESRDWGRGRIIDRFFDAVSDVDWSFIELRRDSENWRPRYCIDLPYLESLNKAKFERAIEEATSVDDMERIIERDRLTPSHENDPIDNISSQLDVPNRN